MSEAERFLGVKNDWKSDSFGKLHSRLSQEGYIHIATITSLLASFTSCPKHLEAIKHVIHLSIADLDLMFSATGNPVLTGVQSMNLFLNQMCSISVHQPKSVCCLVFMIGGTPLIWIKHKEKHTSCSSCEDEIMKIVLDSPSN